MRSDTVQEIRARRSWEELISDGMESRATKDESQWKLGDLALEVETSYGDDALGKFSREVGVRKKTMYEYRRVAKAFPQSARRLAKLSFTHYQIAADTEQPEAWLERADDNDWSCEQLQREIKTQSPKGSVQETKPAVHVCDVCTGWIVDTEHICTCRYVKTYTMPPVQGSKVA